MESFILGLCKDFGTIPTLLLIILVIWFLIRELKKEIESTNREVLREIGNIREDNSKQLKALKDEFLRFKEISDAKDQKLQDMIQELQERIFDIEKNFVSKEDHYKDLGGWREEIKEMRNLILEYMGKEK